MISRIVSENPVVKALVEGTAPRPAQMAAARGVLPLPESDLLEVLVTYARSGDTELAEQAGASLLRQNDDLLSEVLTSASAPVHVLEFYAEINDAPAKAHEAVVRNTNTPLGSILKLARSTKSGSLLEILSLNQQLLVRSAALIDAILANENRTSRSRSSRRGNETRVL